MIGMWHYVYVLQNERGYQYVGLADDLKQRIDAHNRGEMPSTAKYKPWKIVNFTAFPAREQAAAYERYLKSGSGTTFRHKHLVPQLSDQPTCPSKLVRQAKIVSHLQSADCI